MNTITTTYQHHVDPRYFNFIWNDPMYITVEYVAIADKEVTNVSVQSITAPPYLISAVVMYGGWQKLMAEIDESAKQNADKLVASQLHPVMAQALAPFTKHITP
jgi:hypothetical protein